MRKITKAFALGVTGAIGLYLWPPFMMPDLVYWAVYGWRYPKERSCGSAIITDHGPGKGIDRYVVQLGAVDLSQPGRHSWDLCALPAERLVCGLHVALSESRSWDLEKSAVQDAKVSLRLFDHSGTIALEQLGGLGNDWNWSGPCGDHTAFVYGDTVFRASPNETYKLEIQVQPSPSAGGVAITAVAKGGGWK